MRFAVLLLAIDCVSGCTSSSDYCAYSSLPNTYGTAVPNPVVICICFLPPQAKAKPEPTDHPDVA